MPKKVMFLIDKSDDEKNTLDALRSTLGLSVANHYSYAVVMNHTLGKFDHPATDISPGCPRTNILPNFVGLAGREIPYGHGHPHQLLLEDNGAICPF